MNIVIVFTLEGKLSSPFDKPEGLRAYKEFSDLIASRGGRLFYARGKSSYIGENMFQSVWAYDKDELVQLGSPVHADLVFDRSRNFEPAVANNVVNHADIKRVCNDKHETYELFTEHFPLTIMASTTEEFEAALGRMSGLAVVKPVDGAEGEGVLVDEVQNLMSMQPELPVLVQDFSDSTVGIPGIVEGTHDYRVIVCDSDPILSYVRTPPEGSLLANVAQGGFLRVIPIEDIPDELQDTINKIDRLFSKLGPRVYSIDFMNTEDGFKLVELNAQPSMWEKSRDPEIGKYQEFLADYLMKNAESKDED